MYMHVVCVCVGGGGACALGVADLGFMCEVLIYVYYGLSESCVRSVPVPAQLYCGSTLVSWSTSRIEYDPQH